MGLINKMFGTYSERQIKKVIPTVNRIEELSEHYAALSDHELRQVTPALKERLANGETLDEYLARVGTPKSWKFPIGVSDIVDADEWLSKNDISIGKESSNWHEQIDTYIDDLDGEDVLVSVDYHM